jgi:hypothetical protein
MKPWIPACFLFAAVSPGSAAEYVSEEQRLKIQSSLITEASGLAVSPANPDFMWIINDSGGTADLHLAGTDGTDRGKVTLKGCKNTDLEDLASFELDGVSYLLVADTGDNQARRETCSFHILREPKLPAAGKNLSGQVAPAWQIHFRYAGGPRDCESVAVDARAGKILLISKRTDPPEVHELPLRVPGKKGVATALPIGRTEVKALGGSLLPFSSQPTGLDIREDGLLAAVITYHGVFLFPRSPAESWAEAFGRKPVALPPHRLGQAESVAFARDGKTLFAVPEGRNAPILRYRLK